jgi:hypothetical protein
MDDDHKTLFYYVQRSLYAPHGDVAVTQVTQETTRKLWDNVFTIVYEQVCGFTIYLMKIMFYSFKIPDDALNVRPVTRATSAEIDAAILDEYAGEKHKTIG